MKVTNRLIAASLSAVFAAGLLGAPAAATASEEGRKNTAIGLGAAAAYLLLTNKDKVPGLIAGAGAAYAYKKYDDSRRDRQDRERFGYYDRYDNRNRDLYHDRYNDRNYRSDRYNDRYYDDRYDYRQDNRYNDRYNDDRYDRRDGYDYRIGNRDCKDDRYYNSRRR